MSFGVSLLVDNSASSIPNSTAARKRRRTAPPLGGFAPAGSRPSAAPDRYAILPPGIPRMQMCRLRQRVFLFTQLDPQSIPSITALKTPLNWLYRKPRGERSVSIERAEHAEMSSQARFPGRCAHSETLNEVGRVEASTASYGLPGGPRSLSRIIGVSPTGTATRLARPIAKGEPIPQNSPFARQDRQTAPAHAGNLSLRWQIDLMCISPSYHNEHEAV